jgi:hypothetical protein
VARSAFGAARSSLSASHGAAFSTSAARRSGAPNMSSADREYDPEIKDIADYVANKTIDSELAVSAANSAEADFAPRKIPRLEASHLNTNKIITRTQWHSIVEIHC